MVRVLLLRLLRAPAPSHRALALGMVGLLVAAGCTPFGQLADSGDPHGNLACAACHRGATTDRPVASVPDGTCTTSGCHSDGGPRILTLANVEFAHRDHPSEPMTALACSSCHTHPTGDVPLTADVSSCNLCHADALSGEDSSECLDCHVRSQPVAVTNQGVTFPHRNLPWVETGCVRCHYDVARPDVDVATATCEVCHSGLFQNTFLSEFEAGLNTSAARSAARRAAALVAPRDPGAVVVDPSAADSVGAPADTVLAEFGSTLEAIHSGHITTACTSCHTGGGHRVEAMSSAIFLQCSDCHVEIHDVVARAEWPGPNLCVDCHADTHAAQQQVFGGLIPGQEVATPSFKFLLGMNCKSCHLTPLPGTPEAREASFGQAEACVGCHSQEYETVLAWWRLGARQRQERVARYADGAERQFAGADPGEGGADPRLAQVREILRLVEGSGVQHNLELSDRAVRYGVELVREAYRTRGLTPPPPPDLGNRPRTGFCSYCHYRLDDAWDLQEMPEDFHREWLERSRAGLPPGVSARAAAQADQQDR